MKRTPKHTIRDTRTTLPTTHAVNTLSGFTLETFQDRASAERYSDYVGRTFLVPTHVKSA